MFWIFDYLWILRSRTFGMPNDKMQEYLDINLILETSFTLRNGILWKSLIQLIYINISKLIYQQLIFQQLIFQQLFYPTANLSTANLSTANLSTANLITANFSTANFATAFKQGSRFGKFFLWIKIANTAKTSHFISLRLKQIQFSHLVDLLIMRLTF